MNQEYSSDVALQLHLCPYLKQLCKTCSARDVFPIFHKTLISVLYVAFWANADFHFRSIPIFCIERVFGYMQVISLSSNSVSPRNGAINCQSVMSRDISLRWSSLQGWSSFSGGISLRRSSREGLSAMMGY